MMNSDQHTHHFYMYSNTIPDVIRPLIRAIINANANAATIIDV